MTQDEIQNDLNQAKKKKITRIDQSNDIKSILASSTFRGKSLGKTWIQLKKSGKLYFGWGLCVATSEKTTFEPFIPDDGEVINLEAIECIWLKGKY